MALDAEREQTLSKSKITLINAALELFFKLTLRVALLVRFAESRLVRLVRRLLVVLSCGFLVADQHGLHIRPRRLPASHSGDRFKIRFRN